jgi:hypothetical protein
MAHTAVTSCAPRAAVQPTWRNLYQPIQAGDLLT